MDLQDVLLKMREVAMKVISFIFNGDYSILEGWGGKIIISVGGFILAIFTLKEVYRIIKKTIGSILEKLTSTLYFYISNYAKVYGKRIGLRCWYTLKFLWDTAPVRSFKRQAKRKIYTAIDHIAKKVNP